MIKYIIMVCMVALVVIFQNCSDQQFSARSDLNKSMSLDGSEQLVPDDVPEDIVNNDSGGSTSGGSGGSMSGGSASGGSASGGGSASAGSVSGGSMNGGSASAGSTTVSHNEEDDEHDDDDVDSNDDDDDEDVTSSEDGKKGKKVCMRHGEKILANEVGICIVEGPGQSNQISLINEQIVVNNETPRSVCMTAFACRKIVDGKFRVVTLKRTGFCKNGSADSVKLSDQQVQELIDKM